MNATTESPVWPIIRQFGGEEVKFRDLSPEAQMAIIKYMAVDGEAWDWPDSLPTWGEPLTPQEIAEGLEKDRPYYIRKYGHLPFGFVTIPTKVLLETVVTYAEGVREDFEQNSEKYLAWLRGEVTEIRKEAEKKNAKKHYRAEAARYETFQPVQWPVILSTYEMDIIEDGWHRFYRYIENGEPHIPGIYFLRDVSYFSD